MPAPPLFSPSRMARPDHDASETTEAPAEADAHAKENHHAATSRWSWNSWRSSIPRCNAGSRRERMMLKAVETYASVLKASHEAWMDRLAFAKPAESRPRS